MQSRSLNSTPPQPHVGGDVLASLYEGDTGSAAARKTPVDDITPPEESPQFPPPPPPTRTPMPAPPETGCANRDWFNEICHRARGAWLGGVGGFFTPLHVARGLVMDHGVPAALSAVEGAVVAAKQGACSFGYGAAAMAAICGPGLGAFAGALYGFARPDEVSA